MTLMNYNHLSFSQTDKIVAELLARESSLTVPEHFILNETCGAHNYKPLRNIFRFGRGVWLWDLNWKRYMDLLSAYSSCNAGHCNFRIFRALVWQAFCLDTISRAFVHNREGPFVAELSQFCGKDQVLVKNTGVESVETAIKAARRYGYDELKIDNNLPEELRRAEIIVANDNFHGRTLAALSISTEPAYRRGFGPFAPGFPAVPFGDIHAMRAAVNEHTCAVLIEPIQGEAGVKIPPAGYLKAVRDLCTEKGILMIADEIQVGLGRTGKRFACDWENVIPDIYIIGKALGGNFMPVSAIAANNDIMGTFTPGSDGSTFGQNPLACAVTRAYIRVFKDLRLAERSEEMGEYFMKGLNNISSPHITDIRGRGLLMGVEMDQRVRPRCEALMENRLLCKETHDSDDGGVIRFAPPLIITKKQINWAMPKIKKVLEA